MTVRLVEAVPNFSEGRDPATVAALVEAVRGAGADVLDHSADPDHHRCVITAVGTPEAVAAGCVEAARVAAQRIDLRRHEGIHPRIGALDVLPFVGLAGMTRAEVVALAHQTGERIAHEVGVPVYYYAQASTPPGRGLAELRRGGYETLVRGWPDDRQPDVLPDGWDRPGAHETAGATCVGARELLLAWNVHVTGIARDDAAAIARDIRARNDGFDGVRALALDLTSRALLQISMNLEDVETRSPMAVFRRIEALVAERGGAIVETEVIGMLPDVLVLEAAEERLRLAPGTTGRLLSRRLLAHLTDAQRPGPHEA